MIKTAMDFSKFLSSGELSDVVVVVNEKEFKLHKFPLYVKSEFFRTQARSDKARIELVDFPGGPDTFQDVVDYCYNIHVDVSVDNVAQLRCAAEFLQMTGTNNLAGKVQCIGPFRYLRECGDVS